ncbi:inward rectifier potassium channel 16 [Gadus chalcogrammus]|uniref:inward rectifier potassium channel 16 n=1 Tax=Gadus chalcogrammus TaxID=1042646 RepID=UPI0024C2DA04|nr:inward rectifier potassium channel 16 [Gadus chalcogrammus]
MQDVARMCKQYATVGHGDETAALSVTTENGRQHKRLRYVRKEGGCNVLFRHVPEPWLLYVTDIFTTLVEIRWRVMFLIFALSYILSWLFFGILYWVIALANGDLRGELNDPCMYQVRSFTAAFLFSLETQTTIGYGFRGMSENCMVAIVVVTVQDVISCVIDTFVIGIVVAKMASARKRAQTIGFSHCAVVNLTDGFLCLSWRVGDFRRNHMVEGTTRAQMVRSTLHATGRVDVTYKDLELRQSDIILVTPTVITHRIDSRSPLYASTMEDLAKDDFELVVSFTYTDDYTGILHQTRTSYIPPEILWGQLFQDMMLVTRRHYRVDYSMFHHTARVLVPVISAEAYERRKLLQPSPRHSPRRSPRFSLRGSPSPPPGHSPYHSPRHSPHHSPRHSRRPLPRPSPPPDGRGACLKPPSVTVELVRDEVFEAEPGAELEKTLTEEEYRQHHQNTLCPPAELSHT